MLEVGNDLWAVHSSICLGDPPGGADENRCYFSFCLSLFPALAGEKGAKWFLSGPLRMG